MPLLDGLNSVEVPNLLGYGNVACEVKDGTADHFESPLVHPSGFFFLPAASSKLQWNRPPDPLPPAP